MAGIYEWVQLGVDPNKNLDLVEFDMFYLIFFIIILFDYRLGLIELKGTVGPCWGDALYWEPFCQCLWENAQIKHLSVAVGVL